ncbi:MULTISPECIES: hypothetical protein [unclassified Corynebacterium]|uniref:hypothetical protein n=1 Tax=unclassified Corynebacterium TaxID=2624378 RepID=UPI0029CA5064|nr:MULTISPECIES: hypothetical protein [unclassified Corynebacterium]WPF66325.1 hypothetical protein OLX12_00930 [Corynebacterium sp. 22KM0430]WPF68815.1 hypothetical protein OLW90_00930 [Corynebacterium sp. 21KM1197]
MKRYQNVTVETVDEIEGFDEGYVAQAVKDVHAHLGEVEPSDVTYGSGMLLWGLPEAVRGALIREALDEDLPLEVVINRVLINHYTDS